MTMYGAIEAGGTKFVLGVSDEKFKIVERIEIPTDTPQITMPKVVEFFQQYNVDALGLGSFGPIDLNRQSKTYGWITNTPKKNWKDFDILGTLRRELRVNVAVTTDVNVSAYGEYKFGVAQGYNSCVYLTIGTGIGAGAINQGEFVSGLSHPEFGHILIRRDPKDDFIGSCEFHHDCLEGMASGTALEQRTGKKGRDIKSDDVNLTYVANYIGQACLTLALTLDPQVIILGGGVLKHPGLLEHIDAAFDFNNKTYKSVPNLKKYIQLASLNDNQGILGCFALAAETNNY